MGTETNSQGERGRETIIKVQIVLFYCLYSILLYSIVLLLELVEDRSLMNAKRLNKENKLKIG